jgi:hypothetical protein
MAADHGSSGLLAQRVDVEVDVVPRVSPPQPLQLGSTMGHVHTQRWSQRAVVCVFRQKT